jgi:hypothetical protein
MRGAPGRSTGRRDLATSVARRVQLKPTALGRRVHGMLRAAALPHFSWRSSLLSREQSCRPFSYTSRRHNGPKASDVTKKYSDTLLLPKTTFPLYGDPEKSEVAFRQKTSDELYRWQVGMLSHYDITHSFMLQVVGECEGSSLCCA